MTLDEQGAPVSITEAIEYGRQQVLDEIEHLAQLEAKVGDGRGLRFVMRCRRVIEGMWR